MLMKRDVCVVIPIYKKRISKEEEAAILHNCVYLQGVRKFFVAPENLNCDYYRKVFPKVSIIRFPAKFFKNTETYSKLMLSIKFYQVFQSYQYMLICQPDVWLLKTANILRDFAGLGYDYIGAPWFPSMRIQFPSKKYTDWYLKEYELSVGNGGLSLRNIKNTICILKKYFWLKCLWKENEDLFFSFVGEVLDKTYKIPTAQIAKKFSLEIRSRELIKGAGIVPFGVHAYDKYYPELPHEQK